MASTVVKRTDDELVALFTRAQAGDQGALSEALAAVDPLLQKLCRPLEAMAIRTIEPEDVLQEARCVSVLLVKRYRPETKVPPSAYLAFCLKQNLRKKLRRLKKIDSRAVSLDASVGEEDEADNELKAFADPSLVCHQPPTDWELEEVMDRIPTGGGAGHDITRLHLTAAGLVTNLPPDHVLVEHVQAGKTLDEIAEMYSVKRRSVTERLMDIRKSGVQVPRVAKRDKPHSKMRLVPWEEKLAMIATFMRDNPGASILTVKRALGVSYKSVVRAREELGEGV